MQERMYNAVRYQRTNRGLESKKYDYLLKKNDVIKMGRVKLKVNTNFGQKKNIARDLKIRRRARRIKDAIDEKIKEIEKMTAS